jgi:deoxyhypusine synthase
VRKRYVDVVVSTGANLFHDIHEALGMKHYLGTEKADDRHLYKEGINRIYDIFAYDSEFSEADMLIVDVVSDMNGMYSSREFLETLTKKLKKYIVEDSILVAGLESNVPIFCPGISDSSLGIALVLARKKGANIVVDPLKDVEELTDIVIKSTKTGVVYVSGGLPKNFVQQTEVVAEMLGIKKGGHEYAIQFTTDMPQWGGLSGCTIEEGISWGKINERCRKVQVHVDSTIALPLVSHGLIAKERESHPVFVWGKELELKYATRVVV